jgi:hypothetical protein
MSRHEDSELGREMVCYVLCPDRFFVDEDKSDFSVLDRLGVNGVLLKACFGFFEPVETDDFLSDVSACNVFG